MQRSITELALVRAHNLKPGDRLISPKSAFGLIKHHAIYLGYDENYNHYMIENLDTTGVSLTRLDTYFLKNPEIVAYKRYSGSNEQRKVMIQRALSKVGQPYSLITYNCEHFANQVQHNDSSSGQVAVGVITLGILALFAALS